MTKDMRTQIWLNWVWASIFLITATVVLGGCDDAPSTDSTREAADLTVMPDTMTIDRVLRTDDRFSTLVAALDSSGLDSTLAADGPYTLFAPPNTAFARLPEGTIDVLMTERIGRLRTVLSHHVVDGRVDADTLSATSGLQMLSGDSLRVRRDSVLSVGSARVLDDGIVTANGVIHVIDRVLPPPAQEDE